MLSRLVSLGERGRVPPVTLGVFGFSCPNLSQLMTFTSPSWGKRLVTGMDTRCSSSPGTAADTGCCWPPNATCGTEVSTRRNVPVSRGSLLVLAESGAE